ncbi:MAG: orotidine-5'-phosphate decarboxylase [Arenicellales bacterium]
MFKQKLNIAWRKRNSLLCVGLDPDPDKIPSSIVGSDRLYLFNQKIIDATAPWVCAFKPQIAYYSAVGAEHELAQTIDYIHKHHPGVPVILDAKRGDIGATATMYAREAFERYHADAVTVNPYMGGDTLEPFLSYADKGVVILCRTSNPGSGDIQALETPEGSIASLVARMAVERWNKNDNVALVVGATYPAQIAEIRKLVGDMPLLIPGIGAQGGDLQQVLDSGLDQAGYGLMINASRSIIYAGQAKDFAQRAGAEARRLCEEINSLRR